MDFQFFSNNQFINPMEFMIPTVNSQNVVCKNHSLLYMNELKKYTLWAIDMFDSTTKFPTGISSGSIYDTGNFDGCVSVHLPESLGFSGQHCMAHFGMRPLKTTSNATFSYEYKEIYNLTFWDKVAIYDADPRKNTRRDIYMSYCIPSSCTNRDLQNSLQKNIEHVSKNRPFTLDVVVDDKNCQTETERSFSNGGKIFLGIVIFIILLEVICTLYHLLTQLNGAKYFEFSDGVHDILRAFSFSHTITKLTKVSRKENGLESMDGMKVLSTLFVIMGHRIIYTTPAPISNPIFIEETYEHLWAAFFLIGGMVVDTFFTLSGFLACYYILREIQRTNGKVNLAIIYLHRIVRFTLLYAVVLGFYMTIFVHLGDGPFWRERVEDEQERCIENWWTNLLYINNYVNVDKNCLFHTWYLASDMQFFIFVPILASMMWKKPKIGIIGCIALILISMVIHFMVIYLNEEVPFLLLYLDSRFSRDPVNAPGYRRVHIPGHMRATPYFIGVLAAYVKFKYRKAECKIHNWIKNLFWLLFFVIIFGIYITGMYFYSPTEDKNYIVRALFGTSLHFLWGIAIAWFIIATSEGYGELFTWLLSGRIWNILSKLTLTTYLCHPSIQLYSVAILRYPTYAGFFNLHYFATADIVLAYLVGFLVSMVFEAPIMELEKILLRKDRPKPTHNNIGLTETPTAMCDAKEN
ncbi:hypothetical protein WA026_006050 [Henosepilachna vigintioctopunctata]|uniref:Nose resistant-to-fluoxetine protein N-terminal domain-containing protein n=1 Tax=Henosepilachna vigintioctopunctata TaxID=420089 RepID=A0AAW1THT9_9CUCU